MYKYLWNKVENMPYGRKTKHRLFLVLNTLLYGILGLLAWFVLHSFLHKESLTLMLCVCGYPSVIFGLYGSLFYLYKHDQTENRKPEKEVLDRLPYTEKRSCGKVTTEKRNSSWQTRSEDFRKA